MKTISEYLLQNPRLAIIKDDAEIGELIVRYSYGDVHWPMEDVAKLGFVTTFHKDCVDDVAETILDTIIESWIENLNKDVRPTETENEKGNED